MKPEHKRWLAERIAAVPSVRSCMIDREADLVARTWSATITHIHLLDELVKPRQLRKMLNDNSRVGIGTLFVVCADVLPPDGTRIEPMEGLEALHALHRDKVYTYRETENGLLIGQVHLKSFGRQQEYELWYGPPVEIQTLPCFRVWVRTPASIKGDWLIATFGAEPFWKHAAYTAEREALRRQQRGGFTRRAAWTAAGWNGVPHVEDGPNPPAAAAPARHTRLEIAYAHLGLPGGAGSDEVKAAYRRLARELHPDVSNLPKGEAETRFKLLHEAYTFIKVSNGW